MNGDTQHVFVVGNPRSGTTWTMLLLAQHPAIAATQQADLFHALEPLERWWKKSGPHGQNLVGYGASDEGERKPLAELLSLGEFDRLVQPIAHHVFDKVRSTKPGARYVAEQTPENLGRPDLIVRLLPGSRFLHVIRDPRDVYCSMRKAARAWRNDFPTDPGEIARRWAECLAQGRRLADRLGEDYREVRYEALLSDGVGELAKLFDWLDLPNDESLCRQAVETCSIDRLRGSSLGPAGFFRQGQSEAWRREASASAIRCVEFVARPEMERVGYKLAFPRQRQRPWRLALRESLTGPVRRVLGPLKHPLKRLSRSVLGPG